jgi:hypothetical protein
MLRLIEKYVIYKQHKRKNNFKVCAPVHVCVNRDKKQNENL